jgi:hypothetical protein
MNTEQTPIKEVLYNGIQLPSPWPPKIEKLTDEPMPVPYLANPPTVISIDVGRQLFIDDFLIEATDLQRTFHNPQAHPGNPVLKPDKPWEKTAEVEVDHQCCGAYAMPFSDGVWYDPNEKIFKMWYDAGALKGTCYAVSTDGVHWDKPSLDVLPGTNLVYLCRRDSMTVWMDLEEPDPRYRYKMFWFKVPGKGDPTGIGTFNYVASPDGIHWGKILARSAIWDDRSTAFYNPFRKKWVASLRYGIQKVGRFRRYREADNPIDIVTWKDANDNLPWCGSDRLDPVHPEYNFRPELYNLDCVAYESLMLGFFSILRGDALRDLGKPKRNEVFVGFSRDGFHWHRPFRQPFIGVSDRQGDWNWGNVQSAGGGCLVVGDELYFYFSGRAGNGRVSKDEGIWDADGATGLAVLRRDGFASLDAGSSEGFLLTRPVRFSGRFLFVNARVNGELKVEVLDENEKPISGLTREDCLAVQGDKTLLPISWKNGKDLSGLNRKPIRFKFYLANAGLYSFWVSTDQGGASGGYVAAGGPGFTGPTDTVGTTSYRSFKK